jgi:O-antigen/teichoic acid export membrane protein
MLGYVFIFLYTLYANYAFYYKKVWFITFFTVISGIVSVVLNYILIPKYGYKFASVSALISYFILFSLHYINVKYILKIKHLIPIRNILKKTIIIFLSIVFYYAFDFVKFDFFIALGIRALLGISLVYILSKL